MAIDAVAAGKVNLKGIVTACHWFCFARTKEVVTPPVKESIPIGVQLKAAVQNKPYLIALAGQFLFGVTHYGRSANLMYYFKYVASMWRGTRPCLSSAFYIYYTKPDPVFL